MGSRDRAYAPTQKSKESKAPISFTPEAPAIQPKAEAPQQDVPELNPDTSAFQTDWDNPFANCFGSAAPAAPPSLPVQAKLTVGAVGDKYEQEADTVAAQVVKTINSPQPSAAVQREGEEEDELQMKPQEALQRQPEEEDELQMKPQETLQRQPEEEDELQMKPQETLQRQPEEEDELQMKPHESIGHEGGEVSSSLESQIQSARGSGQSLDAGLQQSMGQAMGADFSGVKVHVDSQSDQLNQSIQAKAFTTGQDLFFRSSEYSPGTQSGQALIAHELTHVVQQQPQLQRKNTANTSKRSASKSTTLSRKPQIPSAPKNIIQRSYAALSPMAKARVDQKSEEQYAKKAEEFEFKMAPKIMANRDANLVVDLLVAKVKKIVDAWAVSTGRELGETYEREFGWSGGDDYYGAFEMTAENIKKVFADTSQPMRTKLKLVYNAVRNNNLAKWLKLAAIELDRKARNKKAKNWKIKTATTSVMERDKQGKQTGNFKPQVTLTKEVVKKGFAEKSGLSESLTSQQVTDFSQSAQNQKKTTGPKSKRDVFGHDRFGSMMDWHQTTQTANQERRGGASRGLHLSEQRTLSMRDVPDMTDSEIDQMYLKQGKPRPDDQERQRFRQDPNSKIMWGQGGEFYDIQLGSNSARAAADVKARMEAGISGSTDLMLHAMKNLGLNSEGVLKGMRLALAGWMMANRDHSFYEVYKAADSYIGTQFEIDQNNPGQEYESANNLFPMVRENFADTLPESKFPKYFLSTAYKDTLAGGLAEANKDQTAFNTALQDQGISSKTINLLDKRGTAEVSRLSEVVAGQTINPDERMAKKLQAVRRIKSHNSFIYLGNTLGEKKANSILKALLRKHHAFKGLNESKNIRNVLADIGISSLILDMLPYQGIQDLFKIQTAIKGARKDPKTNNLTFQNVNAEWQRLSTILTPNQRNDINSLLWQTFHGSIFGSAHKMQADETRDLASKTEFRDQAIETLIDVNIPRPYIENLPNGLIYDLQKLKNRVQAAGFDKSDSNTAPATNQQEFAKLRNEFSDTFSKIRQSELILSAIVEHYHTSVVLSEDQQHLADFASLMKSREDRERTGTNRELNKSQLNKLKAPTPEDSKKSILSTQYWSNKNARSRLKTNKGIVLDEYKKKLVAQNRPKAYEIFLKYSKEKFNNSDEILLQQKKILEESNDSELQGHLGGVSEEYFSEILPPEIKQNMDELEGLSDKEIGAIFKYTTAEYVPIVLASNSLSTKDFTKSDVTDPNARKWGGEGGTGALSTLKYTNPMMKALVSGLDKMSPYAGKVYRGENSNRDLTKQNDTFRNQYAQQRSPVGKVEFRAYPMSSSTTEDAPKKAPGGDKFDIFYEISGVKTGKSIELLSNSPEEKEVLFAPGARFKITGTATRNGGELWVYMTEA